MPSEHASRTRIKRRRVAKQRRQESLLDRFRKPQGGLLVATLMLALAAGYGAYGAAVAGKVARGYAGLQLGESHDEVRYKLGTPAAVQAAAWHYPSQAMDMVLRFDTDGRLAGISCATPDGQSRSLCPPVFGVATGTGEVDLEAALGRPSAITQEGATRLYAYDGLGLRFRLAQRQVVEIEHRAPAMGADFARGVLWQLLP